MKKKNMEKPYDGKKSAWVPDKANGGYLEGLCENDMKVADWEAVGKKVNVVVNGKTSAKFSNKNQINLIRRDKDIQIRRDLPGRRLIGADLNNESRICLIICQYTLQCESFSFLGLSSSDYR